MFNTLRALIKRSSQVFKLFLNITVIVSFLLSATIPATALSIPNKYDREQIVDRKNNSILEEVNRNQILSRQFEVQQTSGSQTSTTENNNSTLWMFDYNYSDVLHSGDSGQTYNLPSNSGWGEIRSIAAVPDFPNIAYFLTTSRKVLRTVDYGQTITLVKDFSSSDSRDFPCDIFLNPNNPNEIYVLWSKDRNLNEGDGWLTYSLNGGEDQEWNSSTKIPMQVHRGERAMMNSKGTIVVLISNGTYQNGNIIVDANAIIWRTSDRGQNWSTKPNSEEPIWHTTGMYVGGKAFGLSYSLSNPDYWYTSFHAHFGDTAKFQGVVRSTDDGLTWTEVPFFRTGDGSPNPDGRRTFDVAVDNFDPNLVLALLENTGVYRSTNGGNTWNSPTNSMNVTEGWRIKADPSNSGVFWLLGSDANGNGLFRSIDSGQNWERVVNYCAIINNVNQCYNNLFDTTGDKRTGFDIAKPGTQNPLSTLSFNQPKNNSGDPRECAINGCAGGQSSAGDPINTLTGNFDYSWVDLSIPTMAGPLTFQRTYASKTADPGTYPSRLGAGWTHSQDTRLIIDNANATIWFKAQTANQYPFFHIGGSYEPGSGVLAKLEEIGAGGTTEYRLTDSDHSVYTFYRDASPKNGFVKTWRNSLGQGFDYIYNTSNQLSQVVDTTGNRYIEFQYGGLNGVTADPNLIDHVSDNFGRQVKFTYSDGNLKEVNDVTNQVWTYEYTGNHLLKIAKDPLQRVLVHTEYDSATGNANFQYDDAGTSNQILKIVYGSGSSVVTDANGYTHTDTFNASNLNSGQTNTLGQTVQKKYSTNLRSDSITVPAPGGGGNTTSFKWTADGYRLAQVTDALQNTTRFLYDGRGNLTKVIDSQSTEAQPMVEVQYNDSAHPDLPTLEKDKLNQTVTYTYTNLTGGGLRVVTKRLGTPDQTFTVDYDAFGQVVSSKDELNNETTYAYGFTSNRGAWVKTANPRNRTDQYCYDLADRLVRSILNVQVGSGIPDACESAYVSTESRISTSEYDAAGNLTIATDPSGHKTRLFYNAQNRVETMIANRVGDVNIKPDRVQTINPDQNYAENVRVDYYYDKAGNPIAQIDPLGTITRTYYDELNRPFKITRNLKGTTGQAADWIAATAPPAYTSSHPDWNVTVAYEYDVAGNRVSQSETHVADTGLYTVTTRNYYDALNRPVVLIQNLSNWDANTPTPPNCGQTGVTCDATHNLRTDFVYDALGNQIVVVDTAGTITRTYYDAINRPVYSVNNLIGPANETATQWIAQPTPYPFNPDLPTQNVKTTFQYDDLGRLQSKTAANGIVNRYGYTGLSRLSDLWENFVDGASPSNDVNVHTHYSYNENGNLSAITNPNGLVTSYTYTLFEQVETETLPGQSTHPTKYWYDATGNLAYLKDANAADETVGNRIHFEYDGLNRQTRIDYPGSDRDPEFRYNPAGQTMTVVDAGLGTQGKTSWVYDGLNRATSITDVFNKTVTYSYDPQGNRTSIGYPGGTASVQFRYDALNRLKKATLPDNKTAAYDYDLAGQLDKAFLPNGVVSDYDYNSLGQLKSLSHKAAGYNLGFTYQYDLVGNLTYARETKQNLLQLPLLTYNTSGGDQSMFLNGTIPLQPTPNSKQTTPQSAYPAPEDALPQAQAGTTTGAYPAPEEQDTSSPLDSVGEFFNWVFGTSKASSAGAVSQAYPAPAQGTAQATTAAVTAEINYGYDHLSRLTSANYSNGLAYTYTYDKAGNRTSFTVPGGNAVTMTYDNATGRLQSDGSLTYHWDYNGNLLDGKTTANVKTFENLYDNANRLKQASAAGSTYTYAYNGLGDRVSQSVLNGATTQYSLDLAAGLSQVLQDGTSTYFYGLGRIAQQSSSGIDYSLTDGLGSLRYLTNPSGGITLTQSYDPYGNVKTFSGTRNSSFGFAGEQTDPSGMQYLRARYYNTSLGMFTSRDPMMGGLTQSIGLNAYSYAFANPATLTDPSGKNPFLIAAVVGGLIGTGMELGSQLYTLRDLSLWQAFQCVKWGKVGIAAATGALSGLVGFIGFGAVTAIAGEGLLATIGAGAFSGALAGQYGRLTNLALTGQMSQAGSVLLRPEDLIIDMGLGGLGGAAIYGIKSGLRGISEKILQKVTDSANRELSTNLRAAQNVLTQQEYSASQIHPNVARMDYGNAIERMVNNRINNSTLLRSLFRHVGGPSNPDFVGRGVFSGLNFDITTPNSVPAHAIRSYGPGLIYALYNRPSAFRVFP